MPILAQFVCPLTVDTPMFSGSPAIWSTTWLYARAAGCTWNEVAHLLKRGRDTSDTHMAEPPLNSGPLPTDITIETLLSVRLRPEALPMTFPHRQPSNNVVRPSWRSDGSAGTNPKPTSADGAAPRTPAHNQADDRAPSKPTSADFHSLVTPLLELVAKLTRLDTTFVTHIDWETQTQEVLAARNGYRPLVNQGDSVQWQDSMCRWIFLSGKSHSSDVPGDFPDSIGARAGGFRTFLALPIDAGTITLGTLCGASSQPVDLDPSTLELVDLVAQAIGVQFRSELRRHAAEHRAWEAEQTAAQAAARVADLQANVVELRTLATTDPLTRLANRRGFLAGYERQLANSGRHRQPLGLLLLDIDGFKHVNDRHGHPTGDRVLQALANALHSAVRSGDVVGRIGGDELAVAVVGADRPACRRLAARIQAGFAETTRSFGVPCTVSIGIASTSVTDRHHLMAAADRALYRSKGEGTGLITLWTGDPATGDGTTTVPHSATNLALDAPL